MFLTHISQVTTLLMAGVCVWALIASHWPERITAVAYLLNWIGSAVGQDRRPAHHAQPILIALDLALLGVLLMLTVSCRRTWVLWMTACSALVVLTDLLGALDPNFGQWTWATAYYVWSLGALLAFTLGVALEGRKPAVRLIHLG